MMKKACHKCGYLHPGLLNFYKCYCGACPAKDPIKREMHNDPLTYCKIHNCETDESCCCPVCELTPT